MMLIRARNVHQALPMALDLLDKHGIERESRNGPVIVAPWPVVTEYERSWERVEMWSERDSNPFFHLYEALWMLAGRNDVAPLTRYVHNYAEKFSDNGSTQHGAYGYRWRGSQPYSMQDMCVFDQLAQIAKQLRENPEDRRAVLQMWHANWDLGQHGKDVPCNLIATFQRDHEGKLDLTVFCRSNDILFGCYGANAVHFSFLLEYMALWIDCPIGVYRQISVNWHAYKATLEKVRNLPRVSTLPLVTPYQEHARPTTFLTGFRAEDLAIERLDARIKLLLHHADNGFTEAFSPIGYWDAIFYTMLRAHHVWRTFAAPERYEVSLKILGREDQYSDWVQAGQAWILRRFKTWDEKMSSAALHRAAERGAEDSARQKHDWVCRRIGCTWETHEAGQ